VLAHRPDPDDASAQIDLIGVPWNDRQPGAVSRTERRIAHVKAVFPKRQRNVTGGGWVTALRGEVSG
jgi:hypothetical protein